MRHRVLDPLGLYQRSPYKGLKSWIAAGVLALAAYAGGTYIFRESEPEKPAPVQQMPVVKENIEHKVEREEEVIEAPRVEIIEIEKPVESKAVTIEDVLDDYQIAIMDGSFDFPIKLDDRLYGMAEQFRDIDDETERAKAIFDWQIKNIVYGDGKRNSVGYRDSLETFEDKEGVCGESTYLYVALARAADLKAKVANVHKDFTGKEVHHGCAVVEIGGRQIQVDPAYTLFDAKHQSITVVDDAKAESDFTNWRLNNNGKCT